MLGNTVLYAAMRLLCNILGDLVVLMARRRFVPHEMEDAPKINRTPKMICHVFESEEAQFIAQSIGQAFQVAYMEFLKANGIEDHSFVKEMDYQEVLNSQEIFGDELQMFAKKEMQKEVVVHCCVSFRFVGIPSVCFLGYRWLFLKLKVKY